MIRRPEGQKRRNEEINAIYTNTNWQKEAVVAVIRELQRVTKELGCARKTRGVVCLYV